MLLTRQGLCRAVAAIAGAHSHFPVRAAVLQVCCWPCPSSLSVLHDSITLKFHLRSFMMEYDIHTILDGLSLVATLGVIYEMRFILKNTYQADQDTVQTYYVVSQAQAQTALALPG